LARAEKGRTDKDRERIARASNGRGAAIKKKEESQKWPSQQSFAHYRGKESLVMAED